MNTPLVIHVTKFLNVKAKRLLTPITVKGYDGQSGTAISHYFQLYLTIDRRRQYNLLLLILDLGSHDMIIDRTWLEYFRVMVNVHDQKLVWPKGLPLSYLVIKEIIV